MLSDIVSFFEITLFTFNEEPIALWEILMVPVGILVAFWAARMLIKGVSNRLAAKNKDPNIILLIERILFVLTIAVIFLTTLSLLNIPITAFAFLSGAIAIGFGFGAQNIINNFISGWILIGEKPIRLGDFLELEGFKGTVEQISTRSTRIRRVDGVHLLVPNSKLLENTVINWTLRDKLVRGSVKVGVAYGSDVKLVAQLIEQVALEQNQILDVPPPQVFFQDFGDNALVFEVLFWINSTAEGGIRAAASKVRFAIDESFNQHKIVIAFPQRDIHVDGELKLTR
ncbi:mechanosensitive ion channel family protein [Paraferrimonas sedimenticola]|uniref:Mechanosensitive ion channel protein n=1 Tax=Paraferrimonas sedimenticola TaxID=375674 RepID=A0AA37RVP3_9GAMM|nr:mechanosensitive ion channel domain-containing protein [Paraferrimonas sedimenticola]GLP96285.1 mechanosensitive ion channel protein [Paraferrimonas sedimenticola]